MNSKPLVSICCLSYNHESYIRECLNGFLMQKTNFDFEVLIHDDASTDDTANIIREYEEKYQEIIKPIYQTENQYSKGIGVTRTYNFPRSQGKYIALCEGDDYWTDPLKLQKQVDFLEGNAEYMIHSGKAQILNSNKLTEIIGDPRLKKSYSLPDFLTQNNLVTCTVTFRNQPILKNKFKNLTFGDWLLYVQLLSSKENSLAYVSDDVYSVYRVHEGGVMHTLSKKINSDIAHLKQILAICEVTKERYNGHDIKIINAYCLNIFRYYFRNKKFKKCIETFLQNFKLVHTKLELRSYLGYIRYNYRKI